MHTYRPQKENRAGVVIPIMLLLLCFTCIWAAEMNGPVPPYILQFVGVALVAVAIQIINRYSLTQYVYEIDTESSQFKVAKIVGKKNTLTAAIDFADMKHIDKKVKGYSPKKKYKRAFRVYNFCNNMFSQNAFYGICSPEGEDIAIVIEADAAFLELIETNIINITDKNKGDE